MDAEQLLKEIIDGPIGDMIRERFAKDLIIDLETAPDPRLSEEEQEADREWARSVVDWLRENYV